MKIRTATLADVPAVSAFCVKAFADDIMFELLYPHRFTYPDDFYRGTERRIRTRILARNILPFVAEKDGVPIGIAIWVRDGDDGRNHDVNPACGLLMDLERYIDGLLTSLSTWLWPDRSMATAETTAAVDEAFAAVDRNFWPAGSGGRWHLKFLGIDPAHQRCGVGRALCERGLREARRDRLTAMLEASPPGLGLYLKLGFKVVGELRVEDVMGPVMKWEPGAEEEEEEEEEDDVVMVG